MRYFLILIFLIPGLILSVPSAPKDPQKSYSTQPFIIQNNKWKIGYYEEGDILLYQCNLISTINGLMTLGWIEKTDVFPPKNLNSKELWQYLCKNLSSRYIQFLPDEFYSADWNLRKKKLMSKGIIEKLKEKKKLDMLIVMGLGVGEDLAAAYFEVPVFILSTQKKDFSTIFKKADDSGNRFIYTVKKSMMIKKDNGACQKGTTHAAIIATILNGAMPSELHQNGKTPFNISINSNIAEQDHDDPPIKISSSLEQIYLGNRNIIIQPIGSFFDSDRFMQFSVRLNQRK